MKKIILPLEGTAYHRDLLEFSAALNGCARIQLTAAFVPEADYAHLWDISRGVGDTVFVPPADNSDELVARNSARVKRYCQEHDIVCRVHEDRFDFALGAIRRETRFADLLMLSSAHFFEAVDKHQPNAYMKEILHDAECPVLLMPVEPKLPGEIILTYDGSASSAYAIRQFAYLFPEFNRLRTTVVCINEDETKCMPDEPFVRELCEQHFKNLRMLKLQMRTTQFYDTWVGMMKDPWLVAGAFGRTDWSRLLRHSFINRLITNHNVPLFVAHR